MKALAATSPALQAASAARANVRGLRVDRNRHAAALALAQRGVKPQAVAGHLGRKRLPWPDPRPISRNRPGPPACGRRVCFLSSAISAVDGLPALAVLGRAGDEHHRRRVLDVAVHRRLRGVVEERRQAVELLLRQADRTCGRGRPRSWPSGPARPATWSRCGRGCRAPGTLRRSRRLRWS